MSLYQVAPLTWCPHLTGVERVPACGLDVKGLCEDCDNRGENWICLVCYKVSGGWGGRGRGVCLLVKIQGNNILLFAQHI